MKNNECILAGDLNIDLLKYDSHPETKQYIDLIFANNFLPISFTPTRITDRSSTLIDHIYYSAKKNKLTLESDSKLLTGNIVNDLSDHLINYFVIPFNNKVNLYENRPCVRIYSKNNRELFKAEVSKPDWPNEITSCTDPNLAYEKFYRKLEESFNKCFPLTKLSRKRSKDKLWMTTSLKKIFR